MLTIWRKPNGLRARERVAHDRANMLVKTAVAISFGYPALPLKIGGLPGWEVVIVSLAPFSVVAALYVRTVAALAEVRSLRVEAREYNQKLRIPDVTPQGFMADVDLVALLLAAVLPIAIIMFSSGLVRLQHG